MQWLSTRIENNVEEGLKKSGSISFASHFICKTENDAIALDDNKSDKNDDKISLRVHGIGIIRQCAFNDGCTFGVNIERLKSKINILTQLYFCSEPISESVCILHISSHAINGTCNWFGWSSEWSICFFWCCSQLSTNRFGES